MSSDPTITLPIEIHHEQDGLWYAVYDGEPDVEYPDCYELLRHHGLDPELPVSEWAVYSWKRTEPRRLAAYRIEKNL